MTTLGILAVLMSFGTIMTYINHSWIKLPNNISLLMLSLFVGIGIMFLDPVLHGGGKAWATALLESFNLGEAFLNGLLAFMLFAASISVDLGILWEKRWLILVLSTVGVVISTVFIGTGMWLVMYFLSVHMPFIWCLILGSVLAPTDPVVVAGLIGKAGLPTDMEATIMGESLFNDGVAVVLFTTLLGIGSAWGSNVFPDIGYVVRQMLGEAGGGALLGLAFGGCTLYILRKTDDYGLELMATLALASSSYATALALHVSAPIAVVVAGLGISGSSSLTGGNSLNRKHVQVFWNMLDGILNSLLFMALGLSVILLDADMKSIYIALVSIPIAVTARFMSVGIPVIALPLGLRKKRAAAGMLTWAGLRGGVSVALALSVPEGPFKIIILSTAYAVTVWTILVQGLTMKQMVRFLYPISAPALFEECLPVVDKQEATIET